MSPAPAPSALGPTEPGSLAPGRLAPGRLAIVSAMHEELHRLVDELDRVSTVQLAGRQFHQGELAGHPVVAVLSGIGKVAAACTAALLLQHFGVRALLFSGVAGGLGSAVRVGDLVIADELLQHDLDASPIFPRWEVPLTGRSRFATDPALTTVLADVAAEALTPADPADAERRAALGIAAPVVHRGLVISGDRFVATSAESAALRAALPDALAVEMEGAAVAQVAADFGVPVAVVRSISDRADDAAHVDFARFVHDHASRVGLRLLTAWLAALDARDAPNPPGVPDPGPTPGAVPESAP
jgi:adenosylhomocysteine nucleosidase